MNTRVRHGHSQAYNPSIAVAWLRRELSAPAAIVVFDCALCRVEPVRLAIGREIGDLIDERRKFGCSRHPQAVQWHFRAEGPRHRATRRNP